MQSVKLGQRWMVTLLMSAAVAAAATTATAAARRRDDDEHAQTPFSRVTFAVTNSKFSLESQLSVRASECETCRLSAFRHAVITNYHALMARRPNHKGSFPKFNLQKAKKKVRKKKTSPFCLHLSVYTDRPDLARFLTCRTRKPRFALNASVDSGEKCWSLCRLFSTLPLLAGSAGGARIGHGSVTTFLLQALFASEPPIPPTLFLPCAQSSRYLYLAPANEAWFTTDSHPLRELDQLDQLDLQDHVYVCQFRPRQCLQSRSYPILFSNQCHPHLRMETSAGITMKPLLLVPPNFPIPLSHSVSSRKCFQLKHHACMSPMPPRCSKEVHLHRQRNLRRRLPR